MKAICLYNKGYEAELTLNKSYEIIQDNFSEIEPSELLDSFKRNFIRIRDDSGDLCYYSKKAFRIE